MDTHTRTLVKTFSYRCFVALSIFLAAYFMDYSAGFGATIVVLSFTIGFATFVIHERIWNRFSVAKVGLKDRHLRTIYKTITWRIFSFFTLWVYGVLLGLSGSAATKWSFVMNILFIVVHYTHERVWNMSLWGRKAKLPAEEASTI